MRTLPEVLEALESTDKTLEVLQRELPPVIKQSEIDNETKDIEIGICMSAHAGPEWKAKAFALDSCSDTILVAAESRGRLDAGKTLLKITLGRLDGLRSELSALKAEMEVTRVGYGT